MSLNKSWELICGPCIWLYVVFCTLRKYRDRRKPEAGTMPYSYFEWLQDFFIVYSTIDSTVHSMPLNSLEYCICTTTMTNIWPARDSNLVPSGYKPQSIRINRPSWPVSWERTTNARNGLYIAEDVWTNLIWQNVVGDPDYYQILYADYFLQF